MLFDNSMLSGISVISGISVLFGNSMDPLILYPLRAIIAVSEDDTCVPLHEKTNFSSFFFIFVFLYIGVKKNTQNDFVYGELGRTNC